MQQDCLVAGDDTLVTQTGSFAYPLVCSASTGECSNQPLYTASRAHEKRDRHKPGSWIWRLAVRPRANYLAVGCEDGSVSALQLVFSTVHGLYGDRWAAVVCFCFAPGF